jgi:hypothetical protein
VKRGVGPTVWGMTVALVFAGAVVVLALLCWWAAGMV